MKVCLLVILFVYFCITRALSIIAELLGEAGNRGARSRNVFVCMYIYPSQSTIVTLIDCTIGKMARPIR